jgi:hypothetical protein
MQDDIYRILLKSIKIWHGSISRDLIQFLTHLQSIFIQVHKTLSQVMLTRNKKLLEHLLTLSLFSMLHLNRGGTKLPNWKLLANNSIIWKVIKSIPQSTHLWHSLWQEGNFVVYFLVDMGRDSSVGIALGYGLDNRGSRVRFPAGAGDFSLHHRVQNGSGAHPASHPMGTGGSVL